MDTTRVKIEDVQRGDMIPGWGGVDIADTFSVAEDGTPFWYDTKGDRHAWGRDGTAVIYIPTVHTRKVGNVTGGHVHALTYGGSAVCGTRAGLDFWESGTALAGVTCGNCRRSLRLYRK